MLTAARIREDLAGVDGLRWITTLPAPTIRKRVAAGTVTPLLFDERDLAEITSDEFPMLAYYVEWHMRGKLKPLLFDDPDPQAGEQRRRSVVAPARRSPAALAKAARKRTADDLPVHSFRTLLTDLGTLTVNTMRVADTGASFPLQTRPTPVQQRCFELLGVTLRM